MKTDDMTRHGLLMAAFGLLTAFFNYLYQLCMGIMLTPTQFSTLFSLTSLFTIIIMFMQATQISIARFTSKFKAENSLSKVNYLWRFSLIRVSLLGLAVFLVFALLAPLLSSFLNIDNNWYPIIVFSSLLFAFSLSANWGILQGLQRFLPLGLSNAFWAFLKLAFAALLVHLGLGVFGGLIAFPIAYLIVFLVTLFSLRDLAGAGNEKFEVSGLSSYAGLAFFTTLCFGVLTNIDVVLAKHYLTPENAGNYSAISVLGRIAFFASWGVAIAMFPKTSRLFEARDSTRSALRRAMLLTLLLAGGVIIIYWLFPDFIVNLLFGSKYPLAASYIFRYGIAMLFFAVSFLLMNYFLSLNEMKVAYLFLMVVLLQIGLIYFFHSSISQIVNVMLISGITCLVLLIPFYLKVRKKPPVAA